MQNDVWPLSFSVLIFFASVLLLATAGARFVRVVNRIADQYGWGQAFVGGLLVGGTTSIADTSVTIAATLYGSPSLAISNALGGIAVQCTFLVLIDYYYRRSNLEHAAASVPNLISSAFLVFLLGVALLGALTPEWSLKWFHPISMVLLACYIYAQKLIHDSHKKPMWNPIQTEETIIDPSSTKRTIEGYYSFYQFLAYGLLLVLIGWALTSASRSIAFHTQLSEIAIGTAFTSITTSLPEIIVGFAAVKSGALTLAVGNIIGGNTFDILQLSLADFVYPSSSIYDFIHQEHLFLLVITIMMTAVILIGLLRRERKGPFNIGFEGVTIIFLYLISLSYVFGR